MNNKVIFRILFLGVFLFNGNNYLFAQSNYKEAKNNFALFTKSGDLKVLETAKKFSDQGYATQRDSSSDRTNLLRALIYSALSVTDSNRTLKYSKDPIIEAKSALEKLTDEDFNYVNNGQLIYVRRKIAHAHQIIATRALANNDYQKAFDNFAQVDSFSNGQLLVKRNLAVLSEKLDKKEQAVQYYKDFMDHEEGLKPEYILTMSRLYAENEQKNEELNTLLTGRDKFPKNKYILFRIINIYANNGSYDAIVPVIDEAIALEPENVELNYLAGYANEISGNRNAAEKYYKNVISLDANNYNGNFELGLLYLKDFVTGKKPENQELAQKYLLKANEVNPNAINALKSLAVLFESSNDTLQLERVQNQLNQHNMFKQN